jgi:uncharacterized membrane protein
MGELASMETSMARKMMMALVALAAIGLVQPTVAFARGGGGHGGGGGFHGGGGGFHGGGFHGGGFHGGGFHGGFAGRFHGGFHRRAFVGFGVGPYAYYDDYPYYYGDGCTIVRRRVMTRYGWRIRPVQVCG